MTKEEKEYQEFQLEFTNKVKELKEKYNTLSDNNKQRFFKEIKPFIDSGAFTWLFGNRS